MSLCAEWSLVRGVRLSGPLLSACLPAVCLHCTWSVWKDVRFVCPLCTVRGVCRSTCVCLATSASRPDTMRGVCGTKRGGHAVRGVCACCGMMCSICLVTVHGVCACCGMMPSAALIVQVYRQMTHMHKLLPWKSYWQGSHRGVHQAHTGCICSTANYLRHTSKE